jgi:hypothetical protein
MQLDLLKGLPMHLPKQRPVLGLHMREEGLAAHCVGTRLRAG